MLTGCATKVERISLPDLVTSELSFELIDSRDQAQRRTSYGRTADANVQMLGDDIVVPSRVEVLAKALNRQLGKALRGKTVEVSEFTIRATQYSSGRRDGAALDYSPAGLIGSAIGREVWFATGRSGFLTSSATIKVKIDGAEVTGIGYASVPASAFERELSEMIMRAIDDCVLKVKSSLDPAAK